MASELTAVARALGRCRRCRATLFPPDRRICWSCEPMRFAERMRQETTLLRDRPVPGKLRQFPQRLPLVREPHVRLDEV